MRPFKPLAFAASKVNVKLVRPSPVRPVEWIAQCHRLPGHDILCRKGRFPKTEAGIDEARAKRRDIRRARQIRFFDTAESDRGALGEKRAAPVVRRGAQLARVERVEVIRESSRNKFHLWLSEGPRNT